MIARGLVGFVCVVFFFVLADWPGARNPEEDEETVSGCWWFKQAVVKMV